MDEPRITSAIVVDDASGDDTVAIAELCAAADQRISIIRHEKNLGVGAAMVSGFRQALADGADVIVKIDGDDQMPLEFVPRLIQPLLSGEADYTKGNRFRDFAAIRHMPAVRRLGNLGLGFLAKAATGYWHCFDPTNGFVAIRADVLAQIPLDDVDPTYFFEISMLTHLYLLGATVKEEPMPARYAGEPSSLSIPRVLVDFPGRLLASFLRRLILKNLVYDFGIESLQLIIGVPLLLVGLLFGGYEWFWYVHHNRAAPTGTIVLAALMIIIGFQSLVAAITLDLQSVPTTPINGGPIATPQESERR
jgi:dolichol-phosphate mannosyltransferase